MSILDKRLEGGKNDPYLCSKIGNQACTQIVMEREEELCRDDIHACPACAMTGSIYFAAKIAIFSLCVDKKKIQEIFDEVWEVLEEQKRDSEN